MILDIWKDVSQKGSDLKIYQQREISEDGCEIVFFSRDTEQWNAVLSDVLGPVTKPAGAKPSGQDAKLTKPFGGIWADQTLYSKEIEQGTVIAMLWPWQNNEQTTLKITLVK